nr:actin depolymerizing factor protein [Hymenolepis microstoma]
MVCSFCSLISYLFNDLKLRKDCRYIIYKIEGTKEIVVSEVCERDCDFEHFRQRLLSDNSPCYAALDFEPEKNNSSLVLVSWIPDSAVVKDRMLYASSLDALKSKLVGCKAVLQLNDAGDLTETYFCETIPGYKKA